jgi:general secretion pathway protein G
MMLAATLVVLVARANADSSPCAQVQSELRTLNTALELYQVNHGTYPRATRWFEALQKDGLVRPELGRDPWGRPYLFSPNGAHGPFDLRSSGPDGMRGTADDQIKADAWRWTSCKTTRGGCW